MAHFRLVGAWADIGGTLPCPPLDASWRRAGRPDQAAGGAGSGSCCVHSVSGPPSPHGLLQRDGRWGRCERPRAPAAGQTPGPQASVLVRLFGVERSRSRSLYKSGQRIFHFGGLDDPFNAAIRALSRLCIHRPTGNAPGAGSANGSQPRERRACQQGRIAAPGSPLVGGRIPVEPTIEDTKKPLRPSLVRRRKASERRRTRPVPEHRR
jgi:hypothetical protein